MADPVIPDEMRPHADQIPKWVITKEQMRRFELCFAIGRAVTQRDYDPAFVRQLFFGEIPTDDMAAGE